MKAMGKTLGKISCVAVFEMSYLYSKGIAGPGVLRLSVIFEESRVK
jgi:hypothetical protein